MTATNDLPADVRIERLSLTAADGYPLAAMRYRGSAPARAHLVVGGATAVPQGFYKRFAEHAARRGFDVLTLDYRGIGASAPSTLKGFRMNYLDWGRLDLAAAVEAMRQEGMPLYLVGHSYGGHALGLLPRQEGINGAWTFATGAGWHGWMPPLERLRVLFMWRVLGPVWTRMAGYLPWSRLGMGEDLPLDVYRQWREWCRFPRYFFDDPRMKSVTERFDDVRFPIVAVNALDDAWAPPASRDAFMAGYRNAAVRAVTIDPRLAGLGPIGHMGYFRARAQPLWNEALDWFESRPAATASAGL
ncbi:MAG: alpha/beta fold hydrolase [Hydrogenophaga sp.]|jgi:predicted alpha/beta hydrolase|uniref:alpha/beta hydrolase family protein n=1 Tax=Hydrogenophaga sp. TaxID=1904254 RepID=UPI0026108092|nr:alpha/beta fold hydrolase [Hydrogenophaga sp.]MCV0438623.1 alpha/beta fold hydrolase [Hydrogenophaga sp.]